MVNGIQETAPANTFIVYKTNSTTLRVTNLNSDDHNFEVYDVLGKKVASKLIDNTTDIVDITQLAPGIYFARVGNNTIKFFR